MLQSLVMRDCAHIRPTWISDPAPDKSRPSDSRPPRRACRDERLVSAEAERDSRRIVNVDAVAFSGLGPRTVVDSNELEIGRLTGAESASGGSTRMEKSVKEYMTVLYIVLRFGGSHERKIRSSPPDR
jgi:hypothetical protein